MQQCHPQRWQWPKCMMQRTVKPIYKLNLKAQILNPFMLHVHLYLIFFFSFLNPFLVHFTHKLAHLTLHKIIYEKGFFTYQFEHFEVFVLLAFKARYKKFVV